MIFEYDIIFRNDNYARVGANILSTSYLEDIYAAMHDEMIDSLTMTLHTFFYDRDIPEERAIIKDRDIKGLFAYESSNKTMEDASMFMSQYFQDGENGCQQSVPCLHCGLCKTLNHLYNSRYRQFKRSLRTEHQTCLVIFFLTCVSDFS